jgi:hypothetical protein
MAEPTTTVTIWRLYAEEQQGCPAHVLQDVSTYKWAPRNGFEQWVRAEHPEEGIYVVTSEDGKLSIWRLRYPEFTYQSFSIGKGYPVGEIRQLDRTQSEREENV